MATTLKQLAIRGAIWTFVGYGSRQGLRLLNNLILTRLLVPEFFGLMALVTTVRAGIDLFSEYGITQSVINNKRGDDPAFLNTAWTLQILRGFQVFIISLLLTYPIANLYPDQKDRLLILIPFVGSTAIIDGFRSTAPDTLQRRLNVARLTVYELSLSTLALVLLSLLCWWKPTVWSLAAAYGIGAILNTFASHFLIPGYRNRLCWDQEVLREIRSFGKWIAIASALTFMADQADRFILAKLLSFEKLGVYTIAYTLASVPRELVRELSWRVIFPAISQQADLPRAHLRSKILKQRWLMLLGLGILLAALVAGGDWIITLLYQSRNQNWAKYRDATWIMPILCLGIWFAILVNTVGPALIAIGKAQYSAQSSFARFAVISLGMPFAFSQFGEVGAIAVIAMSDFPLYCVNAYGARIEGLSMIAQDLRATGVFAATLALLLWVRYSLGFGVPIHELLH